MRFIFALIFFISTSAFAAVDAVAPTTNPITYWYPVNGSTLHTADPLSACNAYAVSVGTYVADHITDYGAYGANRYYACWIRNTTTGGVTGGYNTLVYPNSATAPTCPTASPAYTFNYLTMMCERPITCTAGQTLSAGLYDIGTVLNSSGGTSPPVVTCNNSCGANYQGNSVGFRKLVNGVYHYYAQGSYVTNGFSCAAGSSPVAGAAVATLAADTCAAGQSSISMNGVTKCFTSSGTYVDPNSGVPVAPTLAQQVAAAQSAVAGLPATSGVQVTVTVNGGSSGSGLGGSGNSGSAQPLPNLPPNDPLQQTCANDPTLPICKSAQFSAPSGTNPDVSQNWYTKRYPNGVSDVITQGQTALKATPLGGAIASLAFTINAAASSGCWALPLDLGAKFGNWSNGGQMCISSTILNFLGICMMLTAAFTARAIIFGG